MNIAFILFQRLHNLTQPRISRMWNSLMATPYANFFALIGTSLCVFAAFMLIPADLAFFSLMAAVYWGANPLELASQIEVAKVQAHSLSGNSIGSILDSTFNWIIQQISISPSAHMLAGNTIATLTMFFLVFIFITDVIWDHNFLPLQVQRPLHRIILISICITITLWISFYYIFVLVNGDHQKHNAELSTPQISQNLFDDSKTQTETVNPVPIEDNNQSMREIALGAYGVAMILSTALAVWGTAMLVRVVLTLTFLLLLWLSKVFTFFLIEAPYTFLGHRLGFMQIRSQQPPNDREGNSETAGTLAENHNPPTPNTPSAENSQSNPANDENQHSVNNADSNSSEDEIERRLHEEERQRLISKNPLGI